MDDYPEYVAKVDGLTFPEYVHREFPKWVRRGDEEKLVGGAEEESEFMEPEAAPVESATEAAPERAEEPPPPAPPADPLPHDEPPAA